MTTEGPIETNDFERKKQEFFQRIDAGDFDDVIKARDTHEQDQFWEKIDKLGRPTTPDELIESAIIEKQSQDFDKEMAIEEVTGEAERKKDAIHEESKRIVAELQKKAVERGGRLGMLRQEFKEDPKNLEKYLNGEL